MLRAMRRLLPLFAFVALLTSPSMSAAQSGSAPAATPAVKRNQYVYVLRLAPRLYDQKAWTEADNAVVGRHFARLKQATETGQVRPYTCVMKRRQKSGRPPQTRPAMNPLI